MTFTLKTLQFIILLWKKRHLFFQICNDFEFISAVEASHVFDYASLVAEKLGMSPYYLYRQHYMLGNLANIGYAKQGTECIYNMQMMEEQYTVNNMGCSIGSITRTINVRCLCSLYCNSRCFGSCMGLQKNWSITQMTGEMS